MRGVVPLRCGADRACRSRRGASLLPVAMPGGLGSEMPFFLRCSNLKGWERLALGLRGWWNAPEAVLCVEALGRSRGLI